MMGIYRAGENLAVSSRSTQNLPYSINRSILAIKCTELTIIVQSDRSNDSKFEHWDIRLTNPFNRIWQSQIHGGLD